MNYLITAAGKGSRFIKEGIKPPKPLIIVNGIELLIWSLNSFNFYPDDNLYIVTLKNDNVKNRLINKLHDLYPNIKISWLELEKYTNGQLLTSLEAISFFSIKGKLIIHNCDTSFKIDEGFFERIDKNFFGAIPYFNSDGEHWSFIKTSHKKNLIIEVKEKKRISSKCSVGTYFFRNAEEFSDISKKYLISLKQNDCEEFFISPIYDFAIGLGNDVLAKKVSNVKIFGTIKELCSSFKVTCNELKGENDFSGNQRCTLVIDIDKTICGDPINKDYSKCVPIESVCNKIRELSNKGTYIILYTSRNVRTFKGNIGLINKYTNRVIVDWLEKNQIPFDEIYFNKPWGKGNLNYIDDKFISIDDFLMD